MDNQTTTNKKPSLRTVRSLMKRAIKAKERGKEMYNRAEAALEQLIAIGAPIGEPIDMGEDKKFQIADALGGKLGAFHATRFNRFQVVAWKEPKEAK